MKIRDRNELDNYLDGYNAAVRDFIQCINEKANSKNRIAAAVHEMIEKRDFLNTTLGFQYKPEESEV